MAEIPIERKQGRSWLPLILGLIVLLLILGYCYSRRGATTTADTTATTPMTTTPAAGAAPAAGMAAAGTAGDAGSAIDQFAQFVATRDTSAETEANHQYTAEGVRRLATAIEALAGTSPSIAQQADSMRSSIDRLQRSGPKDRHADDARAAFNAAVSAMESIDRARGHTRDVAPMRAIAQQLMPTQPLMQQLGVVQRFFESARDALTAMR